MTVVKSLLLFALAALAEIGGAWLVWQGIREHRGWIWVGAGVIALGLYGFVATLQADANFGRILAAYGGVFVAGSLAWGMVMDGFRPRPLRHRRRADLPGRGRGHHVRPAVSMSRPPVARPEASFPRPDPGGVGAVRTWRGLGRVRARRGPAGGAQ